MLNRKTGRRSRVQAGHRTLVSRRATMGYRRCRASIRERSCVRRIWLTHRRRTDSSTPRRRNHPRRHLHRVAMVHHRHRHRGLILRHLHRAANLPRHHLTMVRDHHRTERVVSRRETGRFHRIPMHRLRQTGNFRHSTRTTHRRMGNSRHLTPTIRHQTESSHHSIPTTHHRMGRSHRLTPTIHHRTGRSHRLTPTTHHRTGRFHLLIPTTHHQADSHRLTRAIRRRMDSHRLIPTSRPRRRVSRNFLTGSCFSTISRIFYHLRVGNFPVANLRLCQHLRIFHSSNSCRITRSRNLFRVFRPSSFTISLGRSILATFRHRHPDSHHSHRLRVVFLRTGAILADSLVVPDFRHRRVVLLTVRHRWALMANRSVRLLGCRLNSSHSTS